MSITSTNSSTTITDTLLAVEESVLGEEQVADAAGADDTDDGGRADIQLERVERVGDVVRQDLGQDGPANRLGPVSPQPPRRLNRPDVDAIDRLGKQLGDDAEVEQDESDDARQRPDPDRRDEDERVQDVGNRSNDAQQRAAERQAHDVRGSDAGDEEGDRHGDRAADGRRHDGDLERLEHRLEGARQELPVRREELPEDAGAARDVGDELTNIEADAELLAQRCPGDGEERDEADGDGERSRSAWRDADRAVRRRS